MLKLFGRNAFGEPILFLALSGENVTRLVAGEPIHLRMGELVAMMAEAGLDPQAAQVAIMYAETDETALAQIRRHVTVNDRRRP